MNHSSTSAISSEKRLTKSEFEAMMQEFYWEMAKHEQIRELEAFRKAHKMYQEKYEQLMFMAD